MGRVKQRGFGDRHFLTKAEWETYLKRMPVRYIKKAKEATCYICGGCNEKDNPLQNAHVIPFDYGIKALALTPDFLDADTNIQTAHRKTCNQAVEETDFTFIVDDLLGYGIKELPDFYQRRL